MRIAFAGTPPFAARALARLHTAGHEVVCVLTQPDRAAGRGMNLQASAVKQWALERAVPVLQPRSLRLEGRFPADALQAQSALQAAGPDVMVVAAYGLLLPTWALSLPRLGCVNIHASLLPRWRGAAPVHRAIEAGDAATGVTIMQMDAGLDTGPMLLARPLDIEPDETTGALLSRLSVLGADLIVDALCRLDRGDLVPQPQPPEGITYANKVEKTESVIDWDQPARVIERRVRAFDPSPGSVFFWGGEAVKLWRAAWVEDCGGTPGQWLALDERRWGIACNRGAVEPLEVQRPGGRRVTFAQYCQSEPGRSIRAGLRLERSS